MDLLIVVLAFVIGVVTGLRSLTAPAVVGWATHLKWLHLEDTGLAFMGNAITAWILTVLAVVELTTDKLPKTPSRKSPGPFCIRIVIGGFVGAALCIAGKQSLVAGIIAGALGAVVGTLGGYESRTRLVKALGVPDFVIALVEDILAIGGGLFAASRVS